MLILDHPIAEMRWSWIIRLKCNPVGLILDSGEARDARVQIVVVVIETGSLCSHA